MKAFLVNLLIALSVALCAFNGVQWYREAKLHGEKQTLAADIYRKSGEIQNLQQTVKVNLEEIKRLEGIREVLGTTIKSNRLMIAAVEEERDKFRQDARIQAAKAAQVEQYKAAYEKANEGITKANEVIQTQNQSMKTMADERNQFVERYNKLAGDYKTLGDDYMKVLGMYTNLVAEVNAANAKNARR